MENDAFLLDLFNLIQSSCFFIAAVMEDDCIPSGTFDIANTRVIGLTEVELIQEVHDGIRKLIEMEKRLEEGEELGDIET